MSLIVIVEKKNKQGNRYYHFTDCETGLERRWYPPIGFKEKDTKSSFEAIARAMEMDAKQIKETVPSDPSVFIKPHKDMLLRDFVNLVYMPRKMITLAENTRDRWQNSLDKHIMPMLGNYKLCELTPLVLSDYLLHLQTIALAHSSVNRHYTILKNILKMACMAGALEENPITKVERPKRRKDESVKTTPPAYTPDEVVHIMNSMEAEPLKYRAMIMIMCETGMRRGECCGLQWDYIHFDTCSIDVVASLYYTKDKGVYLDTTKNQKAHTVYVSQYTIDLLRQLNIINTCTVQSQFVFTKDGIADPIHPHTPTKYFAAFGKKYGVEHMHPHKLRHTFASIAITNGADAVSVAALLGHANTEVLFRYYTSSNEQSIRHASNVYQKAIAEAQAVH